MIESYDSRMAQEFYRKINLLEALRPDDFPLSLENYMMVNERSVTRQLNQDFEGTLNAVTKRL